MAILNPNHLLDQAARLIIPPPAGPPRQVDVRRAISSAYYGAFHATLIAAADEFVGVTKRSSPRYALVYRAVDHKALRELCREAIKPQPTPKYVPYWPTGGFDRAIKRFSAAIIELQEQRHRADYDPLRRFRSVDAQTAISTAQEALERIEAASESRTAFLTLLLFPPR